MGYNQMILFNEILRNIWEERRRLKCKSKIKIDKGTINKRNICMWKGVEEKTIGENKGGGQKRMKALIEAVHGVEQGCPTCSHICKCVCVCVCCKKLRNSVVVRFTTQL